ncbi:helix-turn-helix domain-containing protein [Clostridium butyricum]|uniref:helix-turn-helix domain-containing protein n=1 Tax=Clostridium butyricum TaxID=1492 RepID=UPI003465CB6F
MLKRKRTDLCLTEKKLAEILGINRSYVNKLLNHPERCNPTLNLIIHLAKALDVTPFFVLRFFLNSRKRNQE